MSAKIIFRSNIARILYQTRFTIPERHARGNLSIATFHRVLPEAERQLYPFPGLVVTPEELDAYLTYFTQYFDCGTLANQHKRYLSEEVSTRPLLAITFDDAQYDNYNHARPVLARHNVKASFFVPVMAVEQKELLWHDRLGFAISYLLKQVPGGQATLKKILVEGGLSESGAGSLVSNIVGASKILTLEARLKLVDRFVEASGSPLIPEFARLMTFGEIAEMASDGHEIGSHSMTHCMMPECDDRALAFEVAESRRILQGHVGQPIDSFCYPNGNSDARTALAVANAGYRRAVTTSWGKNGKEANRFLLNRYDMDARRIQDTRGQFVPALLAYRMSAYYYGLS